MLAEARRVIRWKSPPDTPRNLRAAHIAARERALWADVVADLQLHPAEWAVLYEGTRHRAISLATQIRRGRLGGFEFGVFEARSGRVAEGTWATFARYVPDSAS
jgi:hypothetical protein